MGFFLIRFVLDRRKVLTYLPKVAKDKVSPNAPPNA